MFSLEIFKTEKELAKLTGLSIDDLQDNGFDLDDWDYGICINTKDVKRFEKDRFFLSSISNYGCGYEKVSFPNKTFYLLYHA